jgi:hypothetical protein
VNDPDMSDDAMADGDRCGEGIDGMVRRQKEKAVGTRERPGRP